MYKKIFILFIIALLPLTVFAQEDVDSEYISEAVKEKLEVEDIVEEEPVEQEEPIVIASRESELAPAGSARDSPFYLIDRFMEKIRLRMARDELTKMRLHLLFSEERLAEANKLVLENKLEHAKATISAYEGELQEAVLELEAARSRGIDIEQAKQEIKQTTEKHMGILQSIYLGSPDTAKVVLSTAIQAAESSKELAVKIIEQVKEQAEEETEPEQPQAKGETCLAVCIPMWKFDSAANTCTFNECGSGCGPDNIETFETEEECNVLIEEEEEEAGIEYKQLHKGWH